MNGYSLLLVGGGLSLIFWGLVLYVLISFVAPQRIDFTNVDVTKEGLGTRWLLSALRSARGRYLEVAGELRPDIYDQPEIAEAIEAGIERAKRKNRPLTVQIVAGPDIVANPEQGGALSHTFLRLAQGGKIDLYVAETRQPVHFRVVDNGRYVYYEFPHHPLANTRSGVIIRRSRFWAAALEDRFQQIVDGGGVRRLTAPKRDSRQVTKGQLQEEGGP